MSAIDQKLNSLIDILVQMNADITSQNNQYQEIQKNGEEQEKMEKIIQVEENENDVCRYRVSSSCKWLVCKIKFHSILQKLNLNIQRNLDEYQSIYAQMNDRIDSINAVCVSFMDMILLQQIAQEKQNITNLETGIQGETQIQAQLQQDLEDIHKQVILSSISLYCQNAKDIESNEIFQEKQEVYQSLVNLVSDYHALVKDLVQNHK